jgi:hypothetical protein
VDIDVSSGISGSGFIREERKSRFEDGICCIGWLVGVLFVHAYAPWSVMIEVFVFDRCRSFYLRLSIFANANYRL